MHEFEHDLTGIVEILKNIGRKTKKYLQESFSFVDFFSFFRLNNQILYDGRNNAK